MHYLRDSLFTIVCIHVCVCVALINTSITVIQSPGWHVIDLLCWMQSADWVIVLLLRISP